MGMHLPTDPFLLLQEAPASGYKRRLVSRLLEYWALRMFCFASSRVKKRLVIVSIIAFRPGLSEWGERARLCEFGRK